MNSDSLPFPLPTQPLLKVEGLPYPLVASGKVREVFDMGDALLMVATDRVSAFDVIMNEGLAGKGADSKPVISPIIGKNEASKKVVILSIQKILP